uniref:Uncharacterized protein n=1 Tax=Anguilla anguilla TaxID=7936 RepID=A0A0E9THV5_ANGAN
MQDEHFLLVAVKYRQVIIVLCHRERPGNEE